jgi:uncharacterized protein (DUF1778 family)
MALTSPRKDHPIAMRLPAADVAMIDRAARMRGRSRTDFVREAAVRAAEEVVMENQIIRLDTETFAQFMEIINRPVEPVPEILELMKRKAPWETNVEETDDNWSSLRLKA